MAHPAIGYTLSTILLIVTVIALGLPGCTVTNLSATVIQSPSDIQLPTLPAGYVAHYDIGAAYKVYTPPGVTWKMAREQCFSEGAQLAVIDTFIKFESMMNQTSTPYGIWVGILGMYDDTEWVNANTGSTLTTLPWMSGEPSGGFDCVAAGVLPSGNKRGLTNIQCITTYAYVCEVPIPGNYNG